MDDDQDSADLAAFIADHAGYLTTVVIPVEGSEALPAALSFAPDIAVLDIGLPVMDGIALLAAMRERPELHSCRFIALTGYAHTVERALAAGFEAVLVKPVALDALLAALSSATPPEAGVCRSRA